MDMNVSTIDGACHCGTVRFRVRLTNRLHGAPLHMLALPNAWSCSSISRSRWC